MQRVVSRVVVAVTHCQRLYNTKRHPPETGIVSQWVERPARRFIRDNIAVGSGTWAHLSVVCPTRLTVLEVICPLGDLGKGREKHTQEAETNVESTKGGEGREMLC